jgi:hypothetical protein
MLPYWSGKESIPLRSVVQAPKQLECVQRYLPSKPRARGWGSIRRQYRVFYNCLPISFTSKPWVVEIDFRSFNKLLSIFVLLHQILFLAGSFQGSQIYFHIRIFPLQEEGRALWVFARGHQPQNILSCNFPKVLEFLALGISYFYFEGLR